MLTEQLTADAAALHQAILRHGGEVSPFFCGKELGWEHRRIARAMEELQPYYDDAFAAAVEYSILLAKVTKLIRTSAVLED